MDNSPARFLPGAVCATPSALEVLSRAHLLQLLERHLRGDWGDTCKNDRIANERAICNGNRIVSWYYRIATCVSLDCAKLNRAVMTVLTNRLKSQKKSRLVKKGRKLTSVEQKLYGKSKMLRYIAGTNEPVYPIGYVQHHNPKPKRWNICCYTPEGRAYLHDKLRINVPLMLCLMRQPLYGRSAEYADNRISLFSAQWGKCAVTGRNFVISEDIHCHHKKPRKQGGTDKFENLVLVFESVHRLIHATDNKTIEKYLEKLELNKKQLQKVNEFRTQLELQEIA